MTDVFISYSRKDIAFARLLHEALVENGLETWIDWQDIPPSADWLAEVYVGHRRGRCLRIHDQRDLAGLRNLRAGDGPRCGAQQALDPHRHQGCRG